MASNLDFSIDLSTKLQMQTAMTMNSVVALIHAFSIDFWTKLQIQTAKAAPRVDRLVAFVPLVLAAPKHASAMARALGARPLGRCTYVKMKSQGGVPM